MRDYLKTPHKSCGSQAIVFRLSRVEKGVGIGNRLEVRGRKLWFGLAASAAAVAAGAAAIGKWPHAWPWLITITAVVAAGVSPAVSALVAAQQRRANAEKATRQELQGTTGLALPRVESTADLGARVHRAVLPIPYISRDVEDEARRHLESGRPVLLVGPSMVGKSRMAVTFISDMFANRGIVIPDSKGALAALDAADVAVRESVIFLDDIDRLIGVGGITDGSLRRLVIAGNAIVGTIRSAEYDRLQPTRDFKPPEWDVLNIFERIFINRKLSKAEELRLAEAVSDRQVRERIARIGVGEYVGAAQHIEEALALGPSVSPVGYALVLGAADWRRAGVGAPVPGSLLPLLAASHLADRDRVDLVDQQAYEEALQWATREINPTVALLQRQESDSFTVYDYVLDLLSREADPIPEATWRVMIEHAALEDLTGIGHTAEVSYNQSDVALRAWQKAAGSGQADVAASAAFNLGALLHMQGHTDEARAAYQQAIDSGNTDYGPAAAIDLGVLLDQQGEVAGARAAYQQAIDSGHPDYAPAAAVNLGLLLKKQGDVDSARAAWQWAIDFAHPEAAARSRQLLKTLDNTH